MVRIRVELGNRTEYVTVSRMAVDTNELTDDPPDIVLYGIDPSESELLSSDLIWLSGSLGDPRAQAELPYQKFPLVHIPINSEYTVTAIDPSEEQEE